MSQIEDAARAYAAAWGETGDATTLDRWQTLERTREGLLRAVRETPPPVALAQIVNACAIDARLKAEDFPVGSQERSWNLGQARAYEWVLAFIEGEKG